MTSVSRLSVLFILLSITATFVVGDSSNFPSTFRCETVWSGPSSGNEIEECGREQDLNAWAYGFVVCAIPVVFLVFYIVFYPVFFVCRQCCNFCGGRRRQPDFCCSRVTGLEDKDENNELDELYTKTQINRVRVAAFLTFLGTIFVLIFMVHSISELRTSTEDLVDSFLENTVDFFVHQYDLLKETLADPSEASGYVDPVNSTFFDSIDNFVDVMRDTSATYRDDYEPIVTVQVRIALTVFAFVPFVFLFLTPCYASMDRCTGWCPACTTIAYCVFGIVFAIVATLAFLFGLVMTATCGEVEAYHRGDPGVINWYAIPYCDDVRVFDSLHNSLEEGEALYAVEYCKSLTNLCDTAPAYNAGEPNLIYVCGWDNNSAATVCPTLSDARQAAASMTVKTGIDPCDGNPSSCNVTVCASNCTESSVLQAAVVSAAVQAKSVKFYDADAIVTPWQSCSYLVSRIVVSLDSHCEAAKNSTWKVGIACVVGTFLFFVGIIVMFKGQKVFFKKREEDVGSFNDTTRSHSPMGMHEPNAV